MRKKEYDSFKLEVRKDNVLKAEFYEAKGRKDFPEEATGELVLNEDSRYIFKLLNKMLNDASIIEGDLNELGRRLYDTLFPDAIGKLFEAKLLLARKAERGLRLSITIEQGSEVMNWPLEFLKGPPVISWLASRRELAFSRRVIFEKHFDPGEPAERPLRVLIVVSRPEGLGGVMAASVIEEMSEWATDEENEGRAGELPQITVLGSLDVYESDFSGVNYLGETATFKNFRKYYEEIKPHILHFIGHGEIRALEGHLALVDEDNQPNWLSSTGLTDIILAFPPRLVVLQACHTAQKSVARETREGFLSMAEYLLRIRIPAVVAMQFEIQNDYAIEFAKGFYGSLAHGLEVDAAVQEGRSSLYDEHNLRERSFGTPVLYMYSPYVIIEEATKEDTSRPVTYETGHIPGPTIVLPSIDELILQNIDSAQANLEQRDWVLTKQILNTIQSYLGSSSIDASRASMLTSILKIAFERVEMAEQAASEGDEDRVRNLINLIQLDLEACKNIIQFGGTSRGASDLKPQAAPPPPDRGGPPGGRPGPRRGPYPHSRLKSRT